MYQRRVDLLERHQRPGTIVTCGSDSLEKQSSVACNVVFRVVLGESKIKGIASVAGGNAAPAGAECMNQPW